MFEAFWTKVGVGIAAIALAIAPGLAPDVSLLEERIEFLEAQIEDQAESAEVVLGAINPVASGKHKLASGIGATDTSITVQSLTTPDGTEIAMTDFGSIGYATLDPNTTRKEFISFTGISQDAGSTRATLSGVTRGLKFVSPFTADTNLRKSHAGGSILIFSNSPQLLTNFANKANDEVITGTWTATDPTTAQGIATKKYVDDNVVGGTVAHDQTIPKAIAGEAVATGSLVYLDTTQNEWMLTDADTATTVERVLLGIAQGAGTDGNTIAGGVLLNGLDANQSGFAAGDVLYASNTAGGIATSAGTTERVIGQAYDADEIYFDPYWELNPIDETAAYTWSGANSWSATSTFTGAVIGAASDPVVNVYTASTTWTKPANLNYVIVEVVGGGGGGGGSTNVASAAGGGGGGGYARELIAAGDLGATETVTIASGGSGGDGATNATGGTGGTSTFGTHATSTGGVGGDGGSGSSDNPGGAGGVGSGGNVNSEGQDGASGSFDNAGQPSDAAGGTGGSSVLGGGGTDGSAGNAYGGGGGGGGGDGNDNTGGAGADGVIIVTEFYW